MSKYKQKIKVSKNLDEYVEHRIRITPQEDDMVDDLVRRFSAQQSLEFKWAVITTQSHFSAKGSDLIRRQILSSAMRVGILAMLDAAQADRLPEFIEH